MKDASHRSIELSALTPWDQFEEYRIIGELSSIVSSTEGISSYAQDVEYDELGDAEGREGAARRCRGIISREQT
jgi:hypothetical protein